MPLEQADSCELCTTAGGMLLWSSLLCRVVLIEDPDYPGFCRVILNRHAREMTDLPAKERHELMQVVFAVEASLRELLKPEKINLASLGNMTPHVHWHVIPRYRSDRCFPNPIWGEVRRDRQPLLTSVDVDLVRADLGARLGESIVLKAK